MSDANIRQGEQASTLILGGVLDHRSGPLLREQGRELIRNASDAELKLDCSGVERSNSVGLALLLAYLRDAKQAGKSLRFLNLPQELLQIAHVSGVSEFLPIER